MELAGREDCTGCGACYRVCRKGAIAFREDGEGFPAPFIQTEKCVECGLCSQACPVLHKPETYVTRKAYAAQLLDEEALKESSSGGLFTAFAREIFRRGGIVYGCAWDEKYVAVVRKAESESELKPMHRSKYVWSWAGDSFPEIKAYLDAGREVLFTGLPCQAAGLRKYLGKDYEKLYVIACFCGGAPSPMAFQAYLKHLARRVPIEKLNLRFREKERRGAVISYQGRKARVHQGYLNNPYYFAFFTKIFLRRSCYHCLYRYRDRVEDITIGDYWGIEQYHPELDASKGVSAVLVNTEKGENLFKTVKDQLHVLETQVTDIARGNNLTLKDEKKIFPIPGFRDAFFSLLKSKGWSAAERRFIRIRQLKAMHAPERYKRFVKRLIRRL